MNDYNHPQHPQHANQQYAQQHAQQHDHPHGNGYPTHGQPIHHANNAPNAPDAPDAVPVNNLTHIGQHHDNPRIAHIRQCINDIYKEYEQVLSNKPHSTLNANEEAIAFQNEVFDLYIKQPQLMIDEHSIKAAFLRGAYQNLSFVKTRGHMSLRQGYPSATTGDSTFYISLDYKGQFEILRQLECKVSTYTDIVMENDHIVLSGASQRISHQFSPLNRGNYIGAYSMIIFHEQPQEIVYSQFMDIHEIMAVKGNKGDAWESAHAGEMYKKTVFRRNFKSLASMLKIEDNTMQITSD